MKGYDHVATVDPGASRLVQYANFASGPSNPPVLTPSARSLSESVRVAGVVSSGYADARERRQDERYALRNRVLRSITSRHRVAACGWCRIHELEPVCVTRKVQADGEAVSAFAGLQTCGSVWLCPVCSTKIRVQRAKEMERAAVAHLDDGGGLLIGVLTVPHQRFHSLKQVLAVVKESFRSAVSGRAWVKDREEFGVIGFIKAVEVTHGENGWHPHLHLLIFTERPLEPHERQALNERIFTRFARYVQREGLGRPLATYNRIEAVQNPQAVSRYVAKAVLEVGRFDVKVGRVGHRTPFQILSDFGNTGDMADKKLWHEFEQAIPGTNSIRWSRGLKGRYLVEEATDDELAASELEGVEEETFYFTKAELALALSLCSRWERVNGKRNPQARVLRAMKVGGSVAVQLVLLDLEASMDRAPP